MNLFSQVSEISTIDHLDYLLVTNNIEDFQEEVGKSDLDPRDKARYKQLMNIFVAFSIYDYEDNYVMCQNALLYEERYSLESAGELSARYFSYFLKLIGENEFVVAMRYFRVAEFHRTAYAQNNP